MAYGYENAGSSYDQPFPRGEALGHTQGDVFQIVQLSVNEGIVNVKEAVFTDGTISPNRYTFVWGKAIKISEVRIKSQLDKLWKYAQALQLKKCRTVPPVSLKFWLPRK